jgi:flavin prenyltransferase
MKEIVLGITGASGAVYAAGLCKALAGAGCRVHVIVSPHGRDLLKLELGISRVTAAALAGASGRSVVLHDYADLADPLASGSVATDGMAICPCSANTLAAVAAGLSGNLLARAAQVHLKERRPLVLVPREMPVSAIDLENQLRLARAGAIIAPASPGFYHGPKTLQDLLNFVIGRVASCLGVDGLQTAYGSLGKRK